MNKIITSVKYYTIYYTFLYKKLSSLFYISLKNRASRMSTAKTTSKKAVTKLKK